MLQGKIQAVHSLISSNSVAKSFVVGFLLASLSRKAVCLLWLTGCPREMKRVILNFLVKLARRIPSIKRTIAAEKQKSLSQIEASILVPREREPIYELPLCGMEKEQLLTTLQKMSMSEKQHWSNGNLTGAVYSMDADLSDVQSAALSLFGKSNLLHPELFVETRQMEAEVIQMTLNLFSAPPGACGSVTMGGTESILLAVKAYRDWGRAVKNVTKPNIVVPSTAHAAFSKAGQYFEIEVRKAFCDSSYSYEVCLDSMRSLIDGNTVLLVGSAPQYPHGTIDPIPGIAKLARTHNIGCHVDACLGSFLLHYLRDTLMYSVDFSVPGVTSISCDTHKYAYAPKGSSVVMYRDSFLRKFQYSVSTDWEGGLYATPTLLGSRCSSTVVGAWASMMYLGSEKYRECAQKIFFAAKKMEFSFLRDPVLSGELTLLGRVDTSVISFAARQGVLTGHTWDTDISPKPSQSPLNIFDVMEYMHKSTERRWTLAALQSPPGLHFAVTMANADNLDEFCDDLRKAVVAERKKVSAGVKPGLSSSAVIYGTAARVPQILVEELVTGYLDICYEVKGR